MGILQDITERKRAEEALRESEERYRRIIETAYEGIWNIDAENKTIFANSRMAEMLGYVADEMIGKSLFDFMDEEWKAIAAANVEHRRRGVTEQHDFKFRHKDGTELWAIVSTNPFFDKEGRYAGALGMITDITERKRAEEAVRQSEEMWRSLVENSPDFIYMADCDGKVLFINRTFPEHSRNEVIGKSAYDFLAPEYHDAFSERIESIFQNGCANPLSTALIHRDGTRAFFETRYVAIKHGSEVAAVMGISTDITERKRAAEELTRLSSAVKTSVDGIVIMDVEGKITYANEAALRMYGTDDKEAVIGQDILALIAPEHREKGLAGIEFVLEKGYDKSRDYEIITKDGSRIPVELSAAIMNDAGGKPIGIVIVARDITDRKRAEEALRESEERYRAIFEQAADSIVLVDAETGALVEFNERAHENLRYTREEFETLKIPDFEVIESAEEVAKHIEKIVREGTDAFETKHRTKDGEIRDILVSSRALPIAGRDFVQSMWSDITERVRAEAALRRSLEETARGHRLLLALSQAAQAVQRAHTPNEVYHTVGDEVTRLGYNVVVLTLTDDREHLALRHLTFEPALVRRVGKLTGLSAQDFRFPLVPGGFFQRVITEREAIFRESSLELMAEALPQPLYPLVGRLTAMLGTEQGIITPLQVGNEMRGILAVTGAGLTEADVPAMTAFANQAAIALENARLFEEVQAGQERLRVLAQQVVSAQEEERRRIAQELHDELGQALTGIVFDLAAIEKELPPESTPAIKDKLAEASSLTYQLDERVSEIALDLRPYMLDDLGLLPTLRWYVNRYTKRLNIEVEIEAMSLEERLPPQVETALYRVVQEALTNVARHAQANRVSVRLERKESTVTVFVEDDGRGFDVEKIAGPHPPERGAGLLGIRERVASLGGTFSIQSRPGQGTRLTIEIPV